MTAEKNGGGGRVEGGGRAGERDSGLGHVYGEQKTHAQDNAQEGRTRRTSAKGAAKELYAETREREK